MKILIACEFTGTVRNAFLARGHDAWSCDLLPDDEGSNRHIRCDVRDILDDGWDLLIVAHPPCTRLCRSGRRWLSGAGKMTPPKQLPKGRTWDSMKAEFDNGVDLFVSCWRAPVERIAIENPEMHDLAKDRMPPDLPAPGGCRPAPTGARSAAGFSPAWRTLWPASGAKRCPPFHQPRLTQSPRTIRG